MILFGLKSLATAGSSVDLNISCVHNGHNHRHFKNIYVVHVAILWAWQLKKFNVGVARSTKKRKHAIKLINTETGKSEFVVWSKLLSVLTACSDWTDWNDLRGVRSPAVARGSRFVWIQKASAPITINRHFS